MLIANEARRRGTFVPVGVLAIGLGLAVLTLGMMLRVGVREAWLPGLLASLCLGWFAIGVRHARRDGEEIEVRSLAHTQRVPAKGGEVVLQRGGGQRSPHFDVLLQPAGRPALRLARLEALWVGRAPRVARRIAAVLDVPVNERSVGELEAQLGVVAQQRRAGWLLAGGILAVGAAVSVIVPLVADQTMAMLVIRCPGGQVREGSATMLDGVEMTTDPGMHVFELHPAEGPAWTQRVDLVTGQTTVLDCNVRPAPASRHP